MYFTLKKRIPSGDRTTNKQQTMKFDSNKMVFGKFHKFMTEDTFADPRNVTIKSNNDI
jgi:hypothetical protein